MKKYTLEEAKLTFKNEKCKLLTDKYYSNKVKMQYRCRCGRIAYISFDNFLRGHRCMKCKPPRPTKFIFNDVKSIFENAGCKLLENNYKSAKTKLKYKCRCGRIAHTDLGHFARRGHRCGYCGTARQKKYTLKEAKQIFKDSGCELLVEEYNRSNSPMLYRCSCGTISNICLKSFLHQKSRCKQCGIAKESGENNCNWIKDRQQKKINDLFRKRCRNILHKALKAIKLNKTAPTYTLLGYKYADLKNRITTHPNFTQLKDWHIDHIFPIAAFVENNVCDISIINCLENLRPMSGVENLKKCAKYNKQDFEFWLKTKGVNE